MSYGWQDFETVDLFECEECGTAWDSAGQAEQCGSDDRLDRRDRTCVFCGEEWDSEATAVRCEAGHVANDGESYPVNGLRPDGSFADTDE